MTENSDADWRSQLTDDDRQKLIAKIVTVLKDCVTDQGNASNDETRLNSLAAKFEQTVYQSSTNKNHYLHNIANKMYNLKTKAKPNAGKPIAPSGVPNPAMTPFPTESISKLLPGGLSSMGVMPPNMTSLQQSQQLQNPNQPSQTAPQPLQQLPLPQQLQLQPQQLQPQQLPQQLQPQFQQQPQMPHLSSNVGKPMGVATAMGLPSSTQIGQPMGVVGGFSPSITQKMQQHPHANLLQQHQGAGPAGLQQASPHLLGQNTNSVVATPQQNPHMMQTVVGVGNNQQGSTVVMMPQQQNLNTLQTTSAQNMMQPQQPNYMAGLTGHSVSMGGVPQINSQGGLTGVGIGNIQGNNPPQHTSGGFSPQLGGVVHAQGQLNALQLHQQHSQASGVIVKTDSGEVDQQYYDKWRDMQVKYSGPLEQIYNHVERTLKAKTAGAPTTDKQQDSLEVVKKRIVYLQDLLSTPPESQRMQGKNYEVLVAAEKQILNWIQQLSKNAPHKDPKARTIAMPGRPLPGQPLLPGMQPQPQLQSQLVPQQGFPIPNTQLQPLSAMVSPPFSPNQQLGMTLPTAQTAYAQNTLLPAKVDANAELATTPGLVVGADPQSVMSVPSPIAALPIAPVIDVVVDPLRDLLDVLKNAEPDAYKACATDIHAMLEKLKKISKSSAPGKLPLAAAVTSIDLTEDTGTDREVGAASLKSSTSTLWAPLDLKVRVKTEDGMENTNRNIKVIYSMQKHIIEADDVGEPAAKRARVKIEVKTEPLSDRLSKLQKEMVRCVRDIPSLSITSQCHSVVVIDGTFGSIRKDGHLRNNQQNHTKIIVNFEPLSSTFTMESAILPEVNVMGGFLPDYAPVWSKTVSAANIKDGRALLESFMEYIDRWINIKAECEELEKRGLVLLKTKAADHLLLHCSKPSSPVPPLFLFVPFNSEAPVKTVFPPEFDLHPDVCQLKQKFLSVVAAQKILPSVLSFSVVWDSVLSSLTIKNQPQQGILL